MSTILIEFEPSLRDALKDSRLEPDNLAFVESDRLEGGHEVVAALVTLSAATLPIIGKIIIEAHRSKRRIEIKAKGLTVTGLSEGSAMKILDKLLSDD
jgi:hypothetical protein